MKLSDTPLYDEIANGRSKLDVKYVVSNLADEVSPEFIFLHKIESNMLPLEYFSVGEILSGTEKKEVFSR